MNRKYWKRWGVSQVSLLAFLLALTITMSRHQAQGTLETLEAEVYLPVLHMVLTPTPTLPPEPEPVIRITGRVMRADGSGFPDVEIYAGMFCYIGAQPDVFVAKSGADGYYEGAIPCPFGHDETYHVNAVYPGIVFTTEYPCWRDYGHCGSKTANFTVINPGSRR